MHLVLNIYIVLIFIPSRICFACNCFIHHENYKCRLGTKTPYRFIANYNDSVLKFPGCTEKKIWMIIRHGTRYPGKKYIPRMMTELPKLHQIIMENYKLNKTNLTTSQAKLFSKWKLNFTQHDTMNLGEEGEDEMTNLGERYQSRFPSLMPDIYNNQTYKFKYTATQRTEESAKHFTAGLFGWHNSKKVWYPQPEYKDPILRFYKRCPRWRTEIDKNPSAYQEKEHFLRGKIFMNTLDNISKRIGYRISYDSVHLMYLMCGFEIALNKGTDSPWCKIFSINDFKVLEFIEDLEYYWIDGYGYKLSYEQACAALTDMFDFFISDKEITAMAYFSHSGTILKLLALLGIAKDAHPLTHKSFSLYGDSRAWRTSVIDAFASNIAFILYECAFNESRILVMHQERPINLLGCPENMPCPISIMQAMYPDHDEECKFDDMCFSEKNS